MREDKASDVVCVDKENTTSLHYFVVAGKNSPSRASLLINLPLYRPQSDSFVLQGDGRPEKSCGVTARPPLDGSREKHLRHQRHTRTAPLPGDRIPESHQRNQSLLTRASALPSV